MKLIVLLLLILSVVHHVVVVVQSEDTIIENDICYICGTNVTLANGNAKVDVSTILINSTSSIKEVVCNDLNNVAQSKVFTNNDCIALQTSTIVTSTCGCPVEEVPPENDCLLCYNSTLSNITLPNVTVDVSFLNLSFTTVTCKELYDAALDDLLPADSCPIVEVYTNFTTVCGCFPIISNSTDSNTTITSSSISPTMAPVSDNNNNNGTTVCYICNGNETATISNNDTIIVLSCIEPNFVSLQCLDIYESGIAGILPITICDEITITNTTIQSLCGCNNYINVDNVDADVPSIIPSIVPTFISIDDTPSLAPTNTTTTNTCYLCTGIDNSTTIQNPFGVIDVSFIGMGTLVNATCFDMFTAAEQDLFDIDTCTKFSSNITVASICGCSNAPSDMPSISSIIDMMSDVPSSTPSTFSSCYICDGNVDATITNPDTILDTSLFLGNNNTSNDDTSADTTTITCQELYNAGIENLIEPDVCDNIVDDDTSTIQQLCGCQYICYICNNNNNNDEDTTTSQPLVSNPNATINLSMLNNPNIASVSGTCLQLQDAGLVGGLPIETCDAIQDNADIQSICGCPIVPTIPISPVSPVSVVVPTPTTITKPDKKPTSPSPPLHPATVTKPIDASVKQPSKPKPKPKPKLKPKVNPIFRPVVVIHPSPVVVVVPVHVPVPVPVVPTIIGNTSASPTNLPSIKPTDGIVPSIVTDEPTTTIAPIVTPITTTTDEPIILATDEPTPTTNPTISETTTDEPTPPTTRTITTESPVSDRSNDNNDNDDSRTREPVASNDDDNNNIEPIS